MPTELSFGNVSAAKRATPDMGIQLPSPPSAQHRARHFNRTSVTISSPTDTSVTKALAVVMLSYTSNLHSPGALG